MRAEECHGAESSGLDDGCDALPTADAQGGRTVTLPAPAKLVQDGEQKARPACADRMAERDRPAVRVDAIPLESQLVFHGQVLRGECFVDLDHADLVQLELCP